VASSVPRPGSSDRPKATVDDIDGTDSREAAAAAAAEAAVLGGGREIKTAAVLEDGPDRPGEEVAPERVHTDPWSKVGPDSEPAASKATDVRQPTDEVLSGTAGAGGSAF
jgi:hypothetical protein